MLTREAVSREAKDDAEKQKEKGKKKGQLSARQSQTDSETRPKQQREVFVSSLNKEQREEKKREKGTNGNSATKIFFLRDVSRRRRRGHNYLFPRMALPVASVTSALSAVVLEKKTAFPSGGKREGEGKCSAYLLRSRCESRRATGEGVLDSANTHVWRSVYA